MATPPTDLLGQVHVAVIRLDAKVDNVNNELRHLRDEHQKNHADHETRIRDIEKSYVGQTEFQALKERPYVSPATVWKLAGAVTALASLVVAIISVIIK